MGIGFPSDMSLRKAPKCYWENPDCCSERTKHIEIDIHFVRDMVARGHVRVLHVPSRYQYVDIFTKGSTVCAI
ncbi:hypothetical protein Tco_1380761 [Tanacetum coccineum]